MGRAGPRAVIGVHSLSLGLVFLLYSPLSLSVGATSHRCRENNVESIVRSHPYRVFFNPPGCSWFNASETVIAIVKQHIAKAFATHTGDLKTEVEVRKFIWDELQKVRKKLKGSRVMYSIVPELTRALNAPADPCQSSEAPRKGEI